MAGSYCNMIQKFFENLSINPTPDHPENPREETSAKVNQCQEEVFRNQLGEDRTAPAGNSFAWRDEKHFLLHRIAPVHFENKNLKTKVDHYQFCISRGQKAYVELSMEEADELFELTKGDFSHLIKHLKLKTGDCTHLPAKYGDLSQLQMLDLSCSKLTSLPDRVGDLTNLRKLDLKHNKLTSLPGRIGDLANLHKLNLLWNRLESLSNRIGDLTNLRELDLEHNKLTSLPDRVGNLINLHKLILSWNPLESLPRSIVDLTNLELLYLENENLTSLPDNILQFPNSTEINLGVINPNARFFQNLQAAINQPGYNGPRFTHAMQETNQITSDLSLQDVLTRIVNPESSISIENELIPKLTSDRSETKIETLRLWLNRLSELKDARNEEFVRPLYNAVFKQLIEVSENREFADIFYSYLDDATETCGDRVALSVLHLGIKRRLQELKQENDLEKVYHAIQKLFILDQLEKFARNFVDTQQLVDPLEVYLALPVKLRETFRLPIDIKDMLYYSCSNLTEDKLRQAETNVREALESNDWYNYLASHEIWLEILKKTNSEDMEIIESNFMSDRLLAEDENSQLFGKYNEIQTRKQQAIIKLSREVMKVD